MAIVGDVYESRINVKKTVGIMTTSSGWQGIYRCNYGAALQGYALVKQLKMLGYDAYDINYYSDNEYSPQKYSLIERTFRRLLLLTNIKVVRGKMIEIKNRKNIKIWQNKFREFVVKNNLTYNQGQFYRIDDLREISKSMYAVICGSDVVWNPALRNNVCDEGYFLEFASPKTRRIAYAPSFGVSELPKKFAEDMSEVLPTYSGVSIRESSGRELIKKYCGIDAKVVLDPTLLLPTEEYETEIIVPSWLPEKYIAVYQFGLIEHTTRMIEKIQEKTGLPIVRIPARYDDFGKVRFDVGPGEFLGIIQNASLVISDSFHCTVFSLLYHSPFLTFYRTIPEPGKDINSRMIDLLKMVGLEDRLVKPDANVDFSSLYNVDFEYSDSVISQMRRDSLSYLKNALEG